MSYCRFQNTSNDLQACVYALQEDGLRDLSADERRAALDMVRMCEEFLDAMDGEQGDFEPDNCPEYDEGMN